MVARRQLTAAMLLLGLLAGVAGAEPIAASKGQWTGTLGESSGPWRAGPVELRLDGTPERFTVRFAAAGSEIIGGEFRAGERKDVFGAPTSRGLMSLLGKGSEANPLEGKPLTWARRAGEELVVYRLEIANGVHRLDRLAIVPAGDRVNVVFDRREHDKPAARVAAALQRSAR